MCCTRLAENTERKKSPFWHHRTTLSGYIFGIKACIDNRKKLVKQQYLLHMSWQYGELWPTNGWDPLMSLGHPCKFQQLSHLSRVTAWYSSSGRQPNFAALNRGCHLYSAGRPSRWALAHILVFIFVSTVLYLGHLLVPIFEAFVSCWHIVFFFTSFHGICIFSQINLSWYFTINSAIFSSREWQQCVRNDQILSKYCPYSL